jgi:arylsulfatase A-like enzyme
VTGEVDTSGGTIPADNGIYRGGKGSLYEGGTRVVALANWPGQIDPGSVANQPMHIIDWYPTLTSLAGASPDPTKPLDGLNIWPALSAGQPISRDTLGYDVEPFRAAVHQGDWKLVWQVSLPSQVELFNLAHDPSEETNLAHQNRRIVARLKQRVEAMSQEAEFPLLLTEALGAAKSVLFSSVATPEEAEAIDRQP